MKRTIITSLSLLILSTAFSTKYYLSNIGNDSNNGLSTTTPWKTISKLNSSWGGIKAGDTIFFRSGDTFRGMIQPSVSGTSSNPIVLTSYSSGAKPIISGSTVVNSWTLYSGNIWKANLTGFSSNAIESIYANDKLLTPCRYPNSGYLMTTSAGDALTINSTSLTQSNGYWAGAYVTHRTRNWVWERSIVQNNTSGQVTLSTSQALGYTTQSGRGFFFTNKFSALDSVSEWFYDPTTKYMYAWFPGNANPASLLIEVPTYENRYGLLLNSKNNFVVNGLAFKNGSWGGIRSQTSSNIVVQNCSFSKISGAGIVFNSVNSGKILDNNFEYTINSAVRLSACRNYEVKRNLIRQCGRETNYIDGYDRFGIGTAYGYKGKICNNRIDSVGSSAINLVDSLTLVEKNILNYACCELTDNGAIYMVDAGKSKTTTGIYGDTIRSNFIYNTIGFLPGTTYTSTLVQGMDISDFSGNSVFEKNTVYNNSQYGMKIFGGFNNTVKNNICFGNSGAQMFIGTKASLFAQDVVSNNTVKNNLFASTSYSQCSFKLSSDSTNFSFGVYDSNYYYNPYGKYSFELSTGTASPLYYNNYLSRWKVFQPSQDQNSKEALYLLSAYQVNSLVGQNLITNSSFDSNISNWTSSSTSAIWVSSGGIVNGTFKVGSSSTGIISNRSNTFSISSGKTYQVLISCKSSRAAKLKIALQKNNTGTMYSDYRFVEVLPAVKSYSFILKATSSASDAQLVISTIDDDVNFTYYFDDISVKEANTTLINSSDQICLVTNPSDAVKYYSLVGKRLTNVVDSVTLDTVVIQPWTSKVFLISNAPSPIVKKRLSFTTKFESYPNPVRGILNISCTNASKSICEVFDSNGRMVDSMSFESLGYLDFKGKSRGLYFVKLINFETGVFETRKIVVE